MDMLSAARAYVDPPEPAQRAPRSDWRRRKTQIKFHDFITLSRARVSHIRIHAERIAGLERGARKFQIIVFKFRVTEAIAERIKRLAGKIPVRPVLHRIVFKGR